MSQPEAHLFLLKFVYFTQYIIQNGRRIGKGSFIPFCKGSDERARNFIRQEF